MSDDDRFGRLEKNMDKLGDKIDELVKVVVDMAKMEERMITLFKRMDKYDTRMDKVDDRVTLIEKISSKRGAVFHITEKGSWIVFGAAVAYILKTKGG
jgi:SMC interacting uncharacterized protein involved in chromosome segregation